MTTLDWLSIACNQIGLDPNSPGEIVIQNLHRVNFELFQPDRDIRFDTLRILLKQITARCQPVPFIQQDREDLTLFLGCLLKLQIYPTSEMLELFISRQQAHINPTELRTNYYNHRKNKKIINLQNVLKLTFNDIQAKYQQSTMEQNNQQFRFSEFYPVWLSHVMGFPGPLQKLCGDVLAVYSGKTISQPDTQINQFEFQQNLEIQKLEQTINQKLAQQNRMVLKPIDSSYEKQQIQNKLQKQHKVQMSQFNQMQNISIPQFSLPIFTQNNVGNLYNITANLSTEYYCQPMQQNSLIPESQKQNQKSSFQQSNSQLLNQLLTTTHQQHQPQYQQQQHQQQNDFISQNINTNDISTLSVFDPTFNNNTFAITPIAKPVAHVENPFQNIYKPVITENPDLEEVSNALLQLAQYNEKSEGNKDTKQKDGAQSLFSSFM